MKKTFSFRKKKKKEREVSRFREYFELFSEVLIFVFFIQAFLVQTYAIPTPSMEKNMLIGDHLFIDKVAYTNPKSIIEKFIFPQLKIKRGMIVAFKSPYEIRKKNWGKVPYVKRVIGLPGETIKIVSSRVYINGKEIQEPYVYFNGPVAIPENFPPEDPSFWWKEFPHEFRKNVEITDMGAVFRVPEGYYFCMGDNRHISLDSRIWGPVPAENITGKPWRNYWSYISETKDYLSPGILNKIKDLFSTIVHFFTRTRWDRTLKKY